MMRYPSFILTCLFLLSFSVTAFAQITRIDGTIPVNGQQGTIYLDTLSQAGTKMIASSPIDKEGNFSLSVNLSRTDILKLRLEENNYLMLILTPGEQVRVVSPTSKLGVDAFISGSSQTEFLYRAINSLRLFEMRRDSLNKYYNAIQALPERDSLSPIVINEFMKNDSLQKISLMQQFDQSPGTLAYIFLQDKFDMATDFAFIDRTEKELFRRYAYIPFIQQYHQQVESERKTAIGAAAPDISLPDPEGAVRNLSSLKGKVVLIDFWASWCGPCRKENPNVVKAYAKYKEKGFEIFSVSLDKDRESWLKAIANDKLTWPNHVSDLKYWKSAGAAAYGVTAIPYTVLIDKEGKIVAKKLRGDALEQKLAELLR